MEGTAASQHIVVGVDGSDPSRRALGWAIDEARLRDAAVRVVTAWHLPLVLHGGSSAVPPASLSLEELVRQAAEAVASSAEREAREAGATTIEPFVREGQAADVLIDASEGAALLVLGPPGRSGLPGLYIASVSVQCVQHARCPTVVVR